MLITINGMLIRMDVNSISITGRSTQGVRLIRLGEEELVATVAKVEKAEDVEEFDEDGEERTTIVGEELTSEVSDEESNTDVSENTPTEPDKSED
jgi:DNA gyrase subunit A